MNSTKTFMLFRGITSSIATAISGLLIVFFFPPACADLPDSPEGTISLDGSWLFMPDPDNAGTAREWYKPEADRSGWRHVRIPGSWEDYPDMNAYDGYGWFALEFQHSPETGPASLFFGKVDDDATVWVNGSEIGTHEGASEPFALPVGNALRAGMNTVVVRVLDRGLGGGIQGNVALADSGAVRRLLQGEYYGQPARTSAPWVRDAVIYEVYLRSFSPDGTFRALQDRLRELNDLGVTVLWLMPVNPVGLVHRKGSLGSPYSVAEYYGVNPEFGTIEDLKSLVAATHAMGMKMILDLVVNHTAWDNPLIRKHPEWYSTDSSGQIIPPNADWTDVADLNYSRKDMREWIQTMMEYWVRDIGIDGFRCDVAEMVPTDFWEETRKRLDAIKPIMMLSEGALPEHHRAAFDITYSWNLYNAMPSLLSGTQPATFLDRLLESEQNRFPTGSLRMRFNTNHDKNVADGPAIQVFGPEGLRLTTVLVHTFPGVPLIYTGEEVANDRRLSLFEKVEVDWTRPDDMRGLLTKLGRLRHANTALAGGEMIRIPSSDDAKLYAFQRVNGSDAVLVVLNFSGDTVPCRLSLPEGVPSGRFCELFSGKTLDVTSRVDLGAMEGHGYRVFVLEKGKGVN